MLISRMPSMKNKWPLHIDTTLHAGEYLYIKPSDLIISS